MPSLLMAAPSPLKFILPKKMPLVEEQIQDQTVQNRPQTPPLVSFPVQTGNAELQTGNALQTGNPVLTGNQIQTGNAPLQTGNSEDLQLPVAVAVQQPLQTQPKSARKTKQQKEAELALQVVISF